MFHTNRGQAKPFEAANAGKASALRFKFRFNLCIKSQKI